MRDKPAVRKKRESGEIEGAQCPACDAPLKVAPGKVRHKVQCPRCRATVEPVPAGESAEPTEVSPVTTSELEQRVERQQAMIRELESRIQRMEQMLEKLATTDTKAEPDPETEPKMRWLTGDNFPDYSSTQAEVLLHNLRAIRRKPRITILYAEGNEGARARAQWFGRVLAGTDAEVRGPLETTETRLLNSEISLVTSLPVAPGSAAMFLALRAAGFLLQAIYQSEGDDAGDRLVFGA